MVNALHSSIIEGDPPAGSALAMRYRLELLDGMGNTVLATCTSRTVALAAYYAAVREYFGRGLTLRDSGAVMLSCEARPLA